MGNPLPASISLVLESQVCSTRTLALLSISQLGKLHTPSSHLAKMQSSRHSCHPTANGYTTRLSERPDGGVHTNFGSWFLQEGVHIWKSGRCLRLSNCHFARLVPSLSSALKYFLAAQKPVPRWLASFTFLTQNCHGGGPWSAWC